MTMLEEIYEAARQAAPSGTDETLLKRLCEISAAQWESRLKDGMTAEDCRTVFVCAAAWMAVVGIYAQKSVTGWNIESFMGEFSLVICKPDRNVIYTGCQWKSLQESAEVGGNVLEKVTVEAGRRVENLL